MLVSSKKCLHRAARVGGGKWEKLHLEVARGDTGRRTTSQLSCLLLFAVIRIQPKYQRSAQICLILDCSQLVRNLLSTSFYKQDLVDGSGKPMGLSGNLLELVDE